MNICIFCSASDVPDVFVEAAREFAGGLAANGHTMVWGGSDTGLMKVCADAAQVQKGRLIGITMDILKHKARPGADEMIVAPALAERKALLLKRADVIVTMPGGVGTLDELLEILELKKHGVHDKPVIVLNIANFYGGLRQQFAHMESLGFFTQPLAEMLTFVDSAADALTALNNLADQDA